MTKHEQYIDDDGEVRELDDAWFKAAKRGRPALPAGERKQRVNIMLDADLVSAFRATGKGWQTRLNAKLREAVGI